MLAISFFSKNVLDPVDTVYNQNHYVLKKKRNPQLAATENLLQLISDNARIESFLELP